MYTKTVMYVPLHLQICVPVHLGARVCPGRALAYLELKALLLSLARRASFAMVDPEEAWMPVGGPVNGLELDFQPYDFKTHANDE